MPGITSSMKEDKKGSKNREITPGLRYSKNTVSTVSKMATKPIYGKNPLKIFFSRTGRPIYDETWYVVSGTPAHQSFTSDDPQVTLAYFMARSNLVTKVFLWEKLKTVDFSDTIAASDLKVGRCRQLSEIMKVYEYRRSRSLLYHIFPGFVCFVLYKATISGERLQDHWSSGYFLRSNIVKRVA